MLRPSIWQLLTAILIATVLGVGRASHGYVLYQGNPRWTNSIVMNLELGSSGPLIDGSSDWGQSAESAMSLWNPFLRGIQFQVVRNSSAPQTFRDGVNVAFFAKDVYGMGFGDNTLAITLSRWFGTTMIEGDVIFNTAYSWNSYRGNLRFSAHEFRRLAAHEFGHVLGLGHPDDAGQTVAALMNSRESNLEFPQLDDVAGVVSLYGGSVFTLNFPPRNEPFDFFVQLEGKYQNGLRRAQLQTFVDVEGSIVWMQEYLRYRVNQCSHSDAATRVLMQIAGQGIQPICGAPLGPPVNFPPRNESLDFANLLNAYYRDTLRRPTTGSYVDPEGNAVWTQEYLRLRVNNCSHANAVQSVFAQIDGATPICR